MATSSDRTSLQQFGYDDKTGKALADELGITTSQLLAAFNATPLTGGSAPTTNQYGMTTGGQTASRDLTQTVNMLREAKAAGLTGSTGANTGSSGSTTQGGMPTGGNADLVKLGAQGLQAVGLNPSNTATLNPMPGENAGGKSEFAKTGVTPVSQPTNYSLSGATQPQTTVPSVFTAAETPKLSNTGQQGGSTGQAQPQPPTPNVQITQPPSIKVPGAQPPAAPGIMGGVPPMPGNWGIFTDKSQIHNSLASPAGPPLNAGGGASTIKPFATGGMVHGQPGPDRVPAMLTSGEYVMNRDAVKDIGVSNLNAMNRQHYDQGGYVDEEDLAPPYEAYDAPRPSGDPNERLPVTTRSGSTLIRQRSDASVPSGRASAPPAPSERPYTYGEAPYTYGDKPPGFLQRAGRTIEHFFTGQLGQGNQPTGTQATQPPPAPGTRFQAPGDSRNWTPEMANAFPARTQPPAQRPYTYGAPPPAPTQPTQPTTAEGPSSTPASAIGAGAAGATGAGGGMTAPPYDVARDPDPDWMYTGGRSTAGATGAGVPSDAAASAGANPYSSLAGGLAKSAADIAKAFATKSNSTPFRPIPAAFGPGNMDYQRYYNTLLLNNVAANRPT